MRIANKAADEKVVKHFVDLVADRFSRKISRYSGIDFSKMDQKDHIVSSYIPPKKELNMLKQIDGSWAVMDLQGNLKLGVNAQVLGNGGGANLEIPVDSKRSKSTHDTAHTDWLDFFNRRKAKITNVLAIIPPQNLEKIIKEVIEPLARDIAIDGQVWLFTNSSVEKLAHYVVEKLLKIIGNNLDLVGLQLQCLAYKLRAHLADSPEDIATARDKEHHGYTRLHYRGFSFFCFNMTMEDVLQQVVEAMPPVSPVVPQPAPVPAPQPVSLLDKVTRVFGVH